MSYENRKREYERLIAEAKGTKKPEKYYKIPDVLKKEFGEVEEVKEEVVEE